MIGKIFKFFSDDDYYSSDSYYDNERFHLNNYGIVVDKRYGKAYFELNSLKYKIEYGSVVDKSTGESVFRKIDYTRYELIDDNKILDKVTNKEYDDLEDIVFLLNAQNHFIDRTKASLDDEIQALNRAARYESEVGSEFTKVYLKLRDRLKKLQKELFSF